MDISILIPTRNRRDRLLATLDALDQQRLDGAQAELVVVDNGSRDGTLDVLKERRGKLPLMGMEELHKGPSFARNRALPLIRGHVVLLLADDMVPENDGLVAGHLALHREHPGPEYGVLGQVRWAEPMDPFVSWLEKTGFQFSFEHIRAGPVDPAAYLYSSHASFKTETLRDEGTFDRERFPSGLEDTELGIRLRRSGVQLEYRPELLVRHNHPQTLRGSARRARRNGAAARRLRDLYPEEAPERIRESDAKGPLYAPAAIGGRILLAAGARGRLRERAWAAVLTAAYARGWRRG
jgi:glycosyltransferase involved in cell wall biosynthesis